MRRLLDPHPLIARQIHRYAVHDAPSLALIALGQRPCCAKRRTIVGMVTLALNVAAFLFLAVIALLVCIGIGIVIAAIFDNGHKVRPDPALAPDWTP